MGGSAKQQLDIFFHAQQPIMHKLQSGSVLSPSPELLLSVPDVAAAEPPYPRLGLPAVSTSLSVCFFHPAVKSGSFSF